MLVNLDEYFGLFRLFEINHYFKAIETSNRRFAFNHNLTRKLITLATVIKISEVGNEYSHAFVFAIVRDVMSLKQAI